MDILLCTPPSAYRPPNTGQRKRPEVFSPPAMFLPPYYSLSLIHILDRLSYIIGSPTMSKHGRTTTTPHFSAPHILSLLNTKTLCTAFLISQPFGPTATNGVTPLVLFLRDDLRETTFYIDKLALVTLDSFLLQIVIGIGLTVNCVPQIVFSLDDL